MPYPPAPLPLNRTNATPQQDNHPQDHNTISLGINDIVAELGPNPSGPAHATVQARLDGLESYVRTTEITVLQGNLGLVPAGATYDVVQVPLGTRPYDCWVTAIYSLNWGFDATGEAICDADIYRNFDAGSFGGGHQMGAPAGRFQNRVITNQWRIPAGGDLSFKGRITLSGANAIIDGSMHTILQPA